MSIVPMMFRDWWDDWERPSRLLDQHFGVGLRKDDLLSSLSSFPSSSILRNSYFRPWRANLARQESASTINLTKEKFEVTLLLLFLFFNRLYRRLKRINIYSSVGPPPPVCVFYYTWNYSTSCRVRQLNPPRTSDY